MKILAACNGRAVFEHDGGRMSVAFNRTIRLPEDGKTHGLPPSLGLFPVKQVDDYADRVPASWRKHGGVFIPLHQREALWLGFHCAGLPCAVKVAAGKINAVSGKPWRKKLTGADQDYMVAPPQPWLDGFNAGDGVIKQFVAMPMGMGYTAEAQVTGKEKHGGIQLMVIPPKKGKFKKLRRERGALQEEKTGGIIIGGGEVYDGSSTFCSMGGPTIGASINSLSARGVRSASSNMLRSAALPKSAEMGLAGGGSMRQKIYSDPHGLGTWDQGASGRLFVHIINAEMYEQITGERPPASPVEASGFSGPFFDITDDHLEDIEAPDVLVDLPTVSEIDEENGFEGQQNDDDLDEHTVQLGKPVSVTQTGVRDGKW